MSKNLARLKDFIRNSFFINSRRRAPDAKKGEIAAVDEALAATKIVCFQLLFDIEDLVHETFAFEQSQLVVYRHPTRFPLFTNNHTKVDLNWVLQNMNFFRKHITDEHMRTLFSTFDDLDKGDKPSPWREPITQGTKPLSKNWLGSYAYLSRMDYAMLSGGVRSKEYFDRRVDDGNLQVTIFEAYIPQPPHIILNKPPIQSLELRFAENSRLPSGRLLDWPVAFETSLNSLEDDPAKRGLRHSGPFAPQPTESIHFNGRGNDGDDAFSTLGWLNPLPPQGGIPGWQRISFMKHFSDNDLNPETGGGWAYEGVVLPGGRMVLGHSWVAHDPQHHHVS